MLLWLFLLLYLAQCGFGLFLLIFRDRSRVVICAPFSLDLQLHAPAAFGLFYRQAHIFRGGNFWPHVSAVSSSIDLRRPRAVRVKA